MPSVYNRDTKSARPALSNNWQPVAVSGEIARRNHHERSLEADLVQARNFYNKVALFPSTLPMSMHRLS